MEEIKHIALSKAPYILQDIFPNGRIFQNEFMIGNIGGEAGDSLRFNLKTGLWKDFATNEPGGKDIISFIALVQNKPYLEVKKELKEKYGDSHPVERKAFKPITPAPEELHQSQIKHPSFGVPDHIYAYRNMEGELINYVLRWNGKSGGKKTFLPYTYSSNGWVYKQIPDKRPIFGMETISAHADKAVIVCEGEKAAMACRELLKNNAAIAWSGGASKGAIDRADWSVMAGKKCIIWPDNDMPGKEAALMAGKALIESGAITVRIFLPPETVPAKWDAADALEQNFTEKEISAMLTHKDNLLPMEMFAEHIKLEKKDQAQETIALRENHIDAEDTARKKFQISGALNNIIPLGYDRDVYYYYSRAKRQVLERTSSAHGKLWLLSLAPLDQWALSYEDARGKIDWDIVANNLMNLCHDKGVYTADKVRGRGAWWDNNRAVVHCGQRLFVDGVPHDLELKDSRFIYEQGAPLVEPTSNLLTLGECSTLLEICTNLLWEKKRDGYLLAGWIAIAGICGALRWRPHIWINGPKGTGKTWILENIVEFMLKGVALKIEGDTTESGVKNHLGSDALPIIYDESEGEDERGMLRMQQMLMLMRISSSSNGGKILKGTNTNSGSKSFSIRSSFCLGSIGVQIKNEADESRCSVLRLKPLDYTEEDQMMRAEHFSAIRRMWSTFDLNYPERLMARQARMIPTIRENVEIFSSIMSRQLGDKRSGDQIGSLLAGAFSLLSEMKASIDSAERWLKSIGWITEEKNYISPDSDDCYNYLMQTLLTVRHDVNSKEFSIHDLVMMCFGDFDNLLDQNRYKEMAKDVLQRRGLLVEAETRTLYVANRHKELARIYSKTRWEVGWGMYLKQSPYADNADSKTFSISGAVTKVTRMVFDKHGNRKRISECFIADGKVYKTKPIYEDVEG